MVPTNSGLAFLTAFRHEYKVPHGAKTQHDKSPGYKFCSASLLNECFEWRQAGGSWKLELGASAVLWLHPREYLSRVSVGKYADRVLPKHWRGTRDTWPGSAHSLSRHYLAWLYHMGIRRQEGMKGDDV